MPLRFFHLNDYTRKLLKVNGGVKMSKAKNDNQHTGNLHSGRVSDEQVFRSRDVIRFTNNLVELHRLQGTLLRHLESAMGELQVSGILSDEGCETTAEER